MSKVAVMTDSNSGITQKQAEQLGVFVVPMPFMINGETFYATKSKPVIIPTDAPPANPN